VDQRAAQPPAAARRHRRVRRCGFVLESSHSSSTCGQRLPLRRARSRWRRAPAAESAGVSSPVRPVRLGPRRY
jgi:hypothetical protein